MNRLLFVHDSNDDVAFDFRLATETGLGSAAVKNIETLEFIAVRSFEVLHAFFDFTVTGGAGAEPTAGVLNGDTVRKGDIENRFPGFNVALYSAW